MKKFFYLVGILLFSLILTACTVKEEMDPIEVVNNYYTSVIAGDYGIAYDYLSEESKLQFPLEVFKENHELQMKAFKYTDYQITDSYNLDSKAKIDVDIISFKPDTSMKEILFVTLEDGEYKITMNNFFNINTAFACNTLAFENLFTLDKDFDAVLYFSKKAIELDPLSSMAYANIVRAYSLSGNMEAGLEAINKYIYLYPNFNRDERTLSEMYEYKGLNLLGQHKRDEAIQAYKKALEIDSENKNAFLTLQNINN